MMNVFPTHLNFELRAFTWLPLHAYWLYNITHDFKTMPPLAELPFDRQFAIDCSRSRSLKFLIDSIVSIDQKWNDRSIIEIDRIDRV